MVKKLPTEHSHREVISNSEVLTMAVIAHTDFCANYSKALE